MKFPQPLIDRAEELREAFDVSFGEDNQGHTLFSAQKAIQHIEICLSGRYSYPTQERKDYETMMDYLTRKYITEK